MALAHETKPWSKDLPAWEGSQRGQQPSLSQTVLGLGPPAAFVGRRSDLCPLWACQGVHRGQWQHAGVSVRVCKVAHASGPTYASAGFWPLGEDRL